MGNIFNINKTLGMEIGHTHYMIDSNFRTVAQGWSRADGTGPLDLWAAKNPGYVFYTPGQVDGSVQSGGTDAAAIQAAIDAMVDFRGDALFFTPGTYTPATALVINVPDARWLGPAVSNPVCARASLVAGVAAAFAPTTAADRMEVGYLRFVPLTGATMWDSAAVVGLHVHDTFYDTDGIAVDILTVGFVLATTSEHCVFERSRVWVDAAQGPWIRSAGIIKGLNVNGFQLYIEAGTWASAINLAGVGAAAVDIGPGNISGTGAAALTNLVLVADKTVDDSNGFVHGIRSSTHGPTAAALGALTVDVATLDVGDSWLAVVLDQAQPTFTSGGAISWESGVPYTG